MLIVESRAGHRYAHLAVSTLRTSTALSCMNTRVGIAFGFARAVSQYVRADCYEGGALKQVLLCTVCLVGACGCVQQFGETVDPQPIAMSVPTSTSTTTAINTTTTIVTTNSMHASRGAQRDTLDVEILARIARCESGGDYRAQNSVSTASGKYQVLDTTWSLFGGYRHAKDAPPSVQEAQARALYARNGASPWNASRECWDR